MFSFKTSFSFVRAWLKRQWFTPLKWSRVTSCHRTSRAWLLPLSPWPLHTRDGTGSPCPSQSDLLLFSPQPWRDRLWHLVLPPSRMVWGGVRDGGSPAEAERNGASPRKGPEGGCHSRRSGRRLRCLLLCSVSSGKCRLIDEVFFALCTDASVQLFPGPAHIEPWPWGICQH